MRGRKTVAGLAIVALSVLLGACTALPGGATLVGGSAGERHLFRGLTQDRAATSEPARRYIFHIHGMGITGQEVFYQELRQLLSERYRHAEPVQGWSPANLDPAMRVNGELLDCNKPWVDHLDTGNPPAKVDKPCEFPSFGVYRIDRFWNDQDHVVVLYSYFWHRDLWRIQEPHLRADMQRHAGSPAYLNSYLKHDTLDGGLSDAAAYVGPAGQLVRAGISSVLCAMARDAARPASAPRPESSAAMNSLEACGDVIIPDTVQFGFVTHSLGSRMLYDVLAPRAPGGQVNPAALGPARTALIQRTDVVYMAANQLPLLALGRVDVEQVRTGEESAPAPSRDGCTSAVSLLEARRRLARPTCPPAGSIPESAALNDRDLQIVAFADPDDILGYRAGDAAPIGDTAANGGAFIDIVHRNTAQIAWSLALPNLAHDHELKRRETQDMILCGARVARGGAVKPYPCPRSKPR